MKTMFAGITVVCVVLGLTVTPAAQQKRAVEALREDFGATIFYDYQVRTLDDGSLGTLPESEASPPGPAWLRDWIGVDYFADVAKIEASGYRMHDGDFGHLRNFRQLKSLRLFNCEIVTDVGVGHIFANTSLTDLWIVNNNIAKLPPEIGNLTELVQLILNNGVFTTLPPEIGSLRKLRVLSIHGYFLTALPPEIGKLESLEKLHLFSSGITQLPPEIGELANLTRLDLSFSQLTTLPPEIGKLANLESLDLDASQLTTLPPEIGRLAKLKSLGLYGTLITDADLEHLKSLRQLEHLNLHRTDVTKQRVADLKEALPNCSIGSRYIWYSNSDDR